MGYCKIVFPVVMVLCGCESLPQLPGTHAEEIHGFSYVPLDPLPVSRQPDYDCPDTMNYTPSSDEALEMRSESDVQTDRLENLGYRFTPLPLAFPDNAVRIAYKSFDQQGNVSYGPVMDHFSKS